MCSLYIYEIYKTYKMLVILKMKTDEHNRKYKYKMNVYKCIIANVKLYITC